MASEAIKATSRKLACLKVAAPIFVVFAGCCVVGARWFRKRWLEWLQQKRLDAPQSSSTRLPEVSVQLEGSDIGEDFADVFLDALPPLIQAAADANLQELAAKLKSTQAKLHDDSDVCSAAFGARGGQLRGGVYRGSKRRSENKCPKCDGRGRPQKLVSRPMAADDVGCVLGRAGDGCPRLRAAGARMLVNGSDRRRSTAAPGRM